MVFLSSARLWDEVSALLIGGYFHRDFDFECVIRPMAVGLMSPNDEINDEVKHSGRTAAGSDLARLRSTCPMAAG